MKLLLTILSLGICLLSLPTRAQNPAPLEGYFFSFKSCYGRAYSGEHLQAHPDQRVIEMAVSHFPEKQGLLGMESPYQPYPDTPRLALRVDTWLRGKEEGWQDHAICEPDGRTLKCAFECDGGTFSLSGKGKAQILMSLERDLDFNQCDAGDRILNRTGQDTHFLLYPLPASHCLAE